MFLTVRRQTFCSSNVIESMVVVSGNSMTGTQYMNNLAGKSLTVNRLGLGNLTEAFNAADTNGDGEVSQDEFENSNNSILMIDMKIMNLIDCPQVRDWQQHYHCARRFLFDERHHPKRYQCHTFWFRHGVWSRQ
jgi:hypothetical protein